MTRDEIIRCLRRRTAEKCELLAADMLEQDGKRLAELEQIILWALGEGDEFPMPPEALKGRTKYWWRSELRSRYEALAAKGD